MRRYIYATAVAERKACRVMQMLMDEYGWTYEELEDLNSEIVIQVLK